MRSRATFVSLRLNAITIAVIIGVLIIAGRLVSVLVDWLWFSSIGYVDVFWTIVDAKVLLFVAAFAATTAALWISGNLALHYAAASRDPHPAKIYPRDEAQPFSDVVDLIASRTPWRLALLGGAVVLGSLIAAIEVSNWDIALRYLHQVPVGKRDPIFGHDIGFYLFSLPAYLAVKNWLLLLTLGCTLIAGTLYIAHGDITFEPAPIAFSPAAMGHGSVLFGLFFALKAWSYWLDRFRLLYAENGVLSGAA